MTDQNRPMHWDLLVRITHWTVAVLFLVNYWWLDDGDDWHQWLGYGLMALLLLRWVWGFVGPANARFRDFWPTPMRLRNSLKNFAAEHKAEHHQPRHTPLAGVMVISLWLGLLIIGFTGWLQETDRFWGEQWLQQIHTWSAHIVMVAVVVHVMAVLLIQHRYRLPLLRSMIQGR